MLQWKKINGELLAHAQLGIVKIGVRFIGNKQYFALYAMSKECKWEQITYYNEAVTNPTEINPDNPFVKELMEYGEFVFNPPQEQIIDAQDDEPITQNNITITANTPIVNQDLPPLQFGENPICDEIPLGEWQMGADMSKGLWNEGRFLKVAPLKDTLEDVQRKLNAETMYQDNLNPETMFQKDALHMTETLQQNYKIIKSTDNCAVQLEDTESTLIILPKDMEIYVAQPSNHGPYKKGRLVSYNRSMYKVEEEEKYPNRMKLSQFGDDSACINVYPNEVMPVIKILADQIGNAHQIYYNGKFHKVSKVYNKFEDSRFPVHHTIILEDDNGFIYGMNTMTTSYCKLLKIDSNSTSTGSAYAVGAKETLKYLNSDEFKSNKLSVQIQQGQWFDLNTVYHTGA